MAFDVCRTIASREAGSEEQQNLVTSSVGSNSAAIFFISEDFPVPAPPLSMNVKYSLSAIILPNSVEKPFCVIAPKKYFSDINYPPYLKRIRSV